MQNLIDQIIEFSKKKNFSKDIKNFDKFISHFYHENKISDFEKYSIDSLVNFAKSAIDFLSKKRNNNFNLRIYNPNIIDDNFESNHTIIEINSVDMPFLVDSIVAFLDKQSVIINNIIHPVLSVNRAKDGQFIDFEISKNSQHESLIQLHIDKIINLSELNLLSKNISKILETIGL
jgi:glutamate dehydrogenase